jgi:hypothetical protein
MAQITINIPDAVLPRVINGLCDNNGYTVGSGLTRAQYAKKVVIDYIKGNVAALEGGTADRNIRQNVQTELDLT